MRSKNFRPIQRRTVLLAEHKLLWLLRNLMFNLDVEVTISNLICWTFFIFYTEPIISYFGVTIWQRSAVNAECCRKFSNSRYFFKYPPFGHNIMHQQQVDYLWFVELLDGIGYSDYNSWRLLPSTVCLMPSASIIFSARSKIQRHRRPICNFF